MKIFSSAAITLALVATPAAASFSKFMGDDKVTVYKNDQRPMCYSHVEFDDGGSISFSRDLTDNSTAILILKPVSRPGVDREDVPITLYIGGWGKADMTADVNFKDGKKQYYLSVDGTILFDRLAKSDGVIVTIGKTIEAQIQFDGLPMPSIIDATNLCAKS